MTASVWPSTSRLAVGEISFEVSDLHTATSDVIRAATSRLGGHVHFANAWSVVVARQDGRARRAFRSGVCYPDGAPVVWSMRSLSKREKPNRVPGPTLFEAVLDRGRESDLSHYFLGSTPETLANLVNSVERRFPGVRIAGVSSPPFKELEAEDVAAEHAKVREVAPDIVWVGLGTPKQDTFAEQISQLGPEVYACVGAAFDMTAGNVRRAPGWMQQYGLEWLFRLLSEPKRLWRRYILGNPRFVAIVLAQLWKVRRTPETHR